MIIYKAKRINVCAMERASLVYFGDPVYQSDAEDTNFSLVCCCGFTHPLWSELAAHFKNGPHREGGRGLQDERMVRSFSLTISQLRKKGLTNDYRDIRDYYT